jgi:hypothetical protein
MPTGTLAPELAFNSLARVGSAMTIVRRIPLILPFSGPHCTNKRREGAGAERS